MEPAAPGHGGAGRYGAVVAAVWRIHTAYQQNLILIKMPLPSASESPSIEGTKETIPPFPNRFASGGLPSCLPLC
ncbi:hypothetical protein C7U60_09775 [Mesorhizobium plurifarium]|nr:hypothetical protein C7U60_09775 [Mesorhizobium plurifarium]